MGAGGARISLHYAFILNSFHLFHLLKGHFSGIVDNVVQDDFSGGKSPDPQIAIVLLGDQYIKHCSSGKEFKDQNLPLWRNIYIYITYIYIYKHTYIHTYIYIHACIHVLFGIAGQ